MQHEITQRIPLLDGEGNLTQAGFARRLLPVYDRKKVRGGLTRLKEWDYYYIGNDRFGLALTIADNSYMGLDSISFLSFEGKPWEVTKSPMSALPMGRTGLPSTSAAGITASSGKKHAILFQVGEGKRQLTAHMDGFKDGKPLDAQVTLTGEPEESMVICTPFEKKAHFYYNQKINCMRASGVVRIGEEEYRFTPEDSFAVLDWGRGVWTYHNTWYWGSASGLAEGADFGFNIGYGFGDTSAATENMLFYRGRAHKLSQVNFGIPMKDGREDYMKPWRFTSDDGRFKMDFVPVIDRASCTDVKLIKSDQHQVFGRFSGTAVLDGGDRLEVRDLFGFAEKVENKW
ncbi:MAG: DUF2804 domain-containing protein [Oscillospiraceae bacterium]|nr:DUF2804 domain-containing protein [Oscillospiraceae bacterium]